MLLARLVGACGVHIIFPASIADGVIHIDTNASLPSTRFRFCVSGSVGGYLHRYFFVLHPCREKVGGSGIDLLSPHRHHRSSVIAISSRSGDTTWHWLEKYPHHHPSSIDAILHRRGNSRARLHWCPGVVFKEI